MRPKTVARLAYWGFEKNKVKTVVSIISFILSFSLKLSIFSKSTPLAPVTKAEENPPPVEIANKFLFHNEKFNSIYADYTVELLDGKVKSSDLPSQDSVNEINAEKSSKREFALCFSPPDNFDTFLSIYSFGKLTLSSRLTISSRVYGSPLACNPNSMFSRIKTSLTFATFDLKKL